MSMEALIDKYLRYADKVFKDMQYAPTPINVTKDSVDEVLRWATAYLEDAKYYKAQGKLETSLTSIAYCEGLLEALRIIGAVKFEWPTNQNKE
jgi:hypothetical protein